MKACNITEAAYQAVVCGTTWLKAACKLLDKQLLAEDQKIIPTNLSHGNRGFIWSTYIIMEIDVKLNKWQLYNEK